VAVVPVILVFILLFKRYFSQQNNDYNKDSKALKIFKIVSRWTYQPIKSFVLNLIVFIQRHKIYYIMWGIMLALNFNLFTIFIEFVAWYLYFSMSFDLGSVFIQLQKLVLDLKVIFDTVPRWMLVILFVVVLYRISLKIGFARLYHNERRNRGFINSLAIVSLPYGSMGAGKTKFVTDMSLSTEIQFRDDAFEIILEIDMHFPNFPWIVFENELKKAMEYHIVYDKWSCLRWVRQCRDEWQKDSTASKMFDYDFEKYGLEYCNELEVIDIWKSLEDYACAYFIYTVQTSLLISNYSIRVDNVFMDMGNFPLWNSDFFKKDCRLIDSLSRHSHIIDFDMLRLGKIMLDNNPNRNAFGFGIYVVSEIDKERKNSLELNEIKKGDKECNQKNDLFNTLLKMSRHACIVSNRVFTKIFGDLQRPSSLGADALDLGTIIDISDSSEMSPTLPFFSPFYIIDLLYCFLKSRFDNLYIKYRFNRADNTLFMYIFKTIVTKLDHYHERINNLFGSQVLSLELERGTRDGKSERKAKYFIMPKKIYSKRYSTDCLSGIFEARGEINTIGIDDLAEYADIIATNDELLKQQSHFQNDVRKFAK
ncbi:MAG: hypothetical protein K2I78_00185, partial [Clostridia bacterium]|nr:hypothetical protein [Clostridia bacterium]